MEAAAAITYSTLPGTLPALAGGTGACAMAPSFVIATPVASGAGATLLATTSKVLAFASNPVVLLVGVVALGLLFAGKKYLLPIFQAHRIEKARKAEAEVLANIHRGLKFNLEEIKNTFRKACFDFNKNRSSEVNKINTLLQTIRRQADEIINIKEMIEKSTEPSLIENSKTVINAIAHAEYLLEYKKKTLEKGTVVDHGKFRPPYPDVWGEGNRQSHEIKTLDIPVSLFNAPADYNRADLDVYTSASIQAEIFKQSEPLSGQSLMAFLRITL